MLATGKALSDSGMTLIETLVVIGITALITSLAFPRIDRLIGSHARQSQELDAIARIKQTRIRAIQQNMMQEVEINGTRLYFLANGSAIGGPITIESKTGNTQLLVNAVSGNILRIRQNP
jgi:prepilin-type N-terminal cleavage/methylation domain-containing protein